MPTPADRIAELEHQVAALAAVVARLAAADRRERDRDAGRDQPTVALKVAAHEMGLSEAAARKRAQRAAQRGRAGVQRFDQRWYLSRSFIDEVRAGRGMSSCG